MTGAGPNTHMAALSACAKARAAYPGGLAPTWACGSLWTLPESWSPPRLATYSKQEMKMYIKKADSGHRAHQQPSSPGPPGSLARQSVRGSALQDMTGLAREGKRRALLLPLHTLLLLCFHTTEEMCIFKFVLTAAGVTEGAMRTSGVGIGTFPICWGHFCFWLQDWQVFSMQDKRDLILTG